MINGDLQYLITDSRYIEQATEESPTFQVIKARRAVDKVGEIGRDRRWKRIGIEAHHMTVGTYHYLQQYYPDMEWIPLRGCVEQQRQIKDDTEVKFLQHAAEIADRALAAIIDQIRPGISEKLLARALQHEMESQGAAELSFPTIVASGPRASLPHAQVTDRRFAEDDWVTIDFGAAYEGYHSDETVTIPVTKQARSRQLQTMYDIVYQAQKAGIDSLRPGILTSQVDEAVRRVIIEAGYGEYFGHGTGHGVGLDVHEDPFIGPNPERDIPLQAGMVITIEPGIYLPHVGGVRLEDMFHITAQGSVRLTSWDKRLMNT